MAGVRHGLEVDLGGLRFAAPVLAAAGCLGTGRDVPGVVDLQRLGGVVTRSLTLEPVRGGAAPRGAETPSGLLSSVGLQNPGVRAFVEEDLPRLAGAGVPVIGSVAGSTADEYLRVAQVLHVQPGIVALEIYLSGPDRERHGAPFYARPDRVAEIVGAVARLSRLPVFAKLPPLLPDLVSTARAAVRAGAHGLTLIDALPGLSVDVDSLRSRLAAPVGLLSGPAIRPVAVAAVYRVAQELPDAPIMGVGGIRTPADAIEFLLAGAWAVQIGTAMLVDPSVHLEVAKGILAYLKDKGIGSPADLRGRLRPRGGMSAERS